MLPAALVIGGVLLIAERSLHRSLGTLGAVVLVVLAGAGLADLAGGNPSTSATWYHLRRAGGIFGSAIAGGIAKGIGDAGSAVILIAIAFAGCCWLLGGRVTVVLRAIAKGLWSGSSSVLSAARDSLTGAAAPVAPIDAASGVDRHVSSGTTPYDGTPLSAAPPPYGDIDADELAAQDVSVDLTARGPGNVDGVGEERSGSSDAAGSPASEVEIVAAGMLGASVGRGDGDSKAEQLALPVGGSGGSWKLPPMKLLKRSKDHVLDRKEVEARGRVLEQALAAHGVETHLVGFTVGPTVTRFELELGAGVKVARVTNLAKDIAYAMASPDVRILAPIPGRSAIGVEVPNQQRQLVTLGDVLTTTEARRATHPLEVALGRDIAGRPVMANLSEMPHILIAGATGAGKSSCINSVISSILMRATPEDVRLILVDPKRVELGQYNGLPHLLTQVVVNPKRAANALSWAVAEMERRYDLLAEVGMRDVTGYNAAVDRGDFDLPELEALEAAPSDPPAGEAEQPSAAAVGSDGHQPNEGWEVGEDEGAEDASLAAALVEQSRLRAEHGSEPRIHQRLPYILIVVDELNDLMMVAARDVEESICRIAQMARAVGIHLVIATQRPSVDVITGVI